jgi:hypothetical protein
MRLQSKKLEVFADYHQFYLWDRDMNPAAPEDYTDEDVLHRVKAGPHVVVIQPERDMEVAVDVEIHDAEPACDPDEWDHIAEASLHLPTGHLQIHECTGGPVADFKVEPGWYRVRSFHGGFDTIDEDGLDGDDYYKVVLWPAPAAGVVVVKQFAPPEAA